MRLHKDQISSTLESGMFWLFILVSFVVFLNILFFPKVPDFWDLVLIVLWRLLIEKVPYSRSVLITSVCVITILIPFSLVINQVDTAKELAIWLFYIFAGEVGLEVWKLSSK